MLTFGLRGRPGVEPLRATDVVFRGTGGRIAARRSSKCRGTAGGGAAGGAPNSSSSTLDNKVNHKMTSEKKHAENLSFECKMKKYLLDRLI